MVTIDKIEIQSQFVELNFPKATLNKIFELYGIFFEL